MAGQNPGSPTDFQYFYEDEVYKINNRGQVVFGLVLENYEGISSDQESDIEAAVQKGEIRVVWHPSGTERVISEKSVSEGLLTKLPFVVTGFVMQFTTEYRTTIVLVFQVHQILNLLYRIIIPKL
jgi:hypothetical protein